MRLSTPRRCPRMTKKASQEKRGQRLAERLLKFPVGVCTRSHLSESLHRLGFLPCGKVSIQEGPWRITSLPLLLISLTAAMRGTGLEEWNDDTLYMPFCPMPDAGLAEAVCPGCSRVMVPAQGCANFRHCLLFCMTLWESRTKDAWIPLPVNCFYIPKQKVLETITFSNHLPNSLTL